MSSKKQLAIIAVAALMILATLPYGVAPSMGMSDGSSKNVSANASHAGTNDQENPSTVLVGSTSPSSVQASNQLGVSSDSSVPTNAVTSATTPTTITITTNNANPTANQPFTLSGILKAGTTPLSSKSIVIHRVDPSGQWTQVNTTTTDTNGAYTITRSDSQGKYNYYAVFAGDTTYGASNAFVSVTIGA